MQNYGSHILKRINIQAFKFVPVERLHLKMVMNQCLFEYSYGKPVGTAIKNYFFLEHLVCFNLNECSTGQPVGAGWTAYIDFRQNPLISVILTDTLPLTAPIETLAISPLILASHLGVRPRGYLRICWDMIGYEKI
jgi:hypothetical protein